MELAVVASGWGWLGRDGLRAWPIRPWGFLCGCTLMAAVAPYLAQFCGIRCTSLSAGVFTGSDVRTCQWGGLSAVSRHNVVVSPMRDPPQEGHKRWRHGEAGRMYKEDRRQVGLELGKIAVM